MPTVKERESTRKSSFEAARTAGFVVTSRVFHEHHLDYRNWCVKCGQPYIHVRKFRRYADISLDCETSGYPPVCHLHRVGRDAVWSFVERIGVRLKTCMSGGECFLTISTVPNEYAEEVAALLRRNLSLRFSEEV